MKKLKELIRPNILALAPYSTARDDYKGGDISVWLDANESPYANTYNRYPDPHQCALKAKISELKGVPVENIFVGNGSDEAIDLAYRIFCEPGVDNAVAITPSYGMYRVAADINNVEMREVMLGPGFSLPIEELLAAADKHTKLMWVCSPNNPTGNAFGIDELEELLSRFDGIVVVDEAYIDFSDKGSMLNVLDKYPNLIVLQTMSKARGMAALRLGLAFASKEIMEYFGRVKYPYNISALVQQTVMKQLGRDIAWQIAEVKEQRQAMAQGLAQCKCVKRVYPSDANFLLVEVDDADRIYDLLIEHGAIVRNRTKMPGCKNCLRITIGTPVENARVLEVLGGNMPELGGSDRRVTIARKTRETDITLTLDLDRKQDATARISTGLRFFDHMLEQIGYHGGMLLEIAANGDLDVDEHHTMEDVAIVLGQAIDQALGSKIGIGRYGFALPMDDCRALVLLDFGGRIDFEWDVDFDREYVGDMPTEMLQHFFQSLCSAAKCNLQISARGDNAHHKAEAIFKAFARALRMAVARNPLDTDLPSSKGVL